MPDTWNNISWSITSSTETIIQEAIHQRRILQSLQEFATKANKDNISTMLDIYERLSFQYGRFKQDMDNMEFMFERKISDIKQETHIKLMDMEGKMEMDASTKESQIQIMNERLDQMETKSALLTIMDEKIEEARSVLKQNVDENKE